MVLPCVPLTDSAFKRYGRQINMYDIIEDGEPINYQADVLGMMMNNPVASIGACATGPCEPVMKQMERHTNTEEGWIVFDGDCIAAFGEAGTNANDAQYSAFYIKKGTIMSINAGVWHYAPFSATDKNVRVAAVLPPKTPENDIEVQQLAQELTIEGW